MLLARQIVQGLRPLTCNLTHTMVAVIDGSLTSRNNRLPISLLTTSPPIAEQHELVGMGIEQLYL